MTTIATYGGPLKRDLITQAYGICGQAGYEFEIEAEEFAAANRILDRLMRTLLSKGIDLGYNFPASGAIGNVEDESGIPDDTEGAVIAGLAMRIAPTIGKTIAPEARADLAAAWQTLFSSYVSVPTMQLGRNTIAGAGNRRLGRWNGPFLPTDLPINEVVSGDSIVVVP